MDVIEQTEIDGVPTFFVKRPGPLQAGLAFRVGRADETLATAGITHLIEHLALHRQGVADYHYNGATASLVTVFSVQGTTGHVTEYLNGVCEGLADPPMHRLETEKTILRTEAAGRTDPVMPLQRYGAQGRGLVSCRELGLERLGADDIRAWTRTWFTRENAVMWMVGADLPEGLRLDLPAGRRMPVTPPESVLRQTPAYFADGSGGIAMNAVVTRSAAAQVYTMVLERELFRSLRRDGGYSYTAEAAYLANADDHAEVLAFADALPDKQDAVVGEFIDVLAKLTAGRVDPADIESVRTKAEGAFSHPDFDVATLPGRAFGHLVGRQVPDRERLWEELAAVSAKDVAAVAQEAHASSLVMVPQGHSLDWAGYEEIDHVSRFETSAGYRYPSLSGDGCELVIGPEGVTVTSPVGPATVAYQDCAAMLTYPDGARVLVGRDGIQARVEPTLFDVPKEKLAAIDATVDPAAVVPMPARDPQAIPRVDRPDIKSSWRKRLRNLAISSTVSVLLLGTAIYLAGAWTPDDGELAEKFILWLLMAGLFSLVAPFVQLVAITNDRKERRQALTSGSPAIR